MLNTICAVVGTVFTILSTLFAAAAFFGWSSSSVLSNFAKTWHIWLILIIGIALLITAWIKQAKTTDTAQLTLRIYGDSRVPERITALNIWRWYYLGSGQVVLFNGVRQNSITRILFVTFEPEVKITTLTVNSPDMALPQYEVQEFNQRYAIISFANDLPSGTLEIKVVP